MIWFPDAQELTLIQDISQPGKQLTVIALADDRPTLEEYARKYLARGCDIIKEETENTYRLICPIEVVESDESNLVKAAE